MALPQLSKALILNTDTGERIQVMYNPEQYSLEQGNNFAEVGIPGLNGPPVQYVRGKLRSLSMELFFDTYEQGQDVRGFTNQISGLLDQNPRTHAPPVLLFTMGTFSFRCVLIDAGQRFTMFLRDGTPVRSTMTVRFQEFHRVEVEIQAGLFIGPPTLQNIASGQTVASLAADEMGAPDRWREVAEANNLDDPFNVPAGKPLVIPGRGT